MAVNAEQADDIRYAEVVTADEDGQVYRIVQVPSSLEAAVSGVVRDVNKRQTNVWSHSAILQLLEHRIALDRQFVLGPSVKRPLWNKIAAAMHGAGFEVSAQECHVKWRNLLMTYRKNRDRAARLGEERVVWEYFHIMHPVFMHYVANERASAIGDKGGVDAQRASNHKRTLSAGTACNGQPPSKAGRKSPATSDVDEEARDDEDEFDDDMSLLEPDSPTGSTNEVEGVDRGAGDDVNPLVWFRQYLQQKTEEDQRRERREERMWNEYRELEERKLEVMAQLTDVLIRLKDQHSNEG